MSQAVHGETAPGAGRPTFSPGYRALVLGLLLASYTFNFIDRTIIATIGQAIKVDLKISDQELGLLGGFYFAVFYTFLGIPIARLAERYSRTWIITISLVIWSGFTALCGAAANFGQLALLRFGVGVGEAGGSPPAHSLISDFYPPGRRASALAIYSLGIPIGTMFGAVVGGWLAQHFSWRAAFVVVGLPGLLLALAIRFFIKEPVRGAADVVERPRLAEDVSAPPERRGLLWELRELGSVGGALFGSWPVLNMVLGVTISSFASYGGNGFWTPFFVRNFGLGLATAGLLVGLISGLSAGAGTLLGGYVTDALGKRSARWYALVPAFGLLIAAPLYLIAYQQKTWLSVFLILLTPGVFHYTYLAPTFGVVQNSVDVLRRATATAILFFFLNLIALGGGPPFCGWLIDRLAGWNFVHTGGIWDAVGGAFGKGGVVFNHVCPGGLAPKGADAATAARCKAVLASSTRQGITVQALFYLWASAHYFLAAIGMVRHMARRAAAA